MHPSSSNLSTAPTLNAYAPPLRHDINDDVHPNNFQELADDFSFDCVEPLSSPIPADQIFHNGKIKPIINGQFHQPFLLSASDHPIPNRGNLLATDVDAITTSKVSKRKALRSLFTEERQRHDQQHSSESVFVTASESELVSASSTTELDSVPADTYCVWEPKTATSEKGTSKRWRLRNLLTRNVSSKDNSQSRSGGSINKNLSKVNNDDDDDDEKKNKKKTPQAVTKGGGSGSGRRSSYLPYRQELVGIFGTSNSASTFLQRF